MDEDYDDPFLRESYNHYKQGALHQSSVTNQLQTKYWTAKSLVKKLKKKEDESVVAADADLDAKLEFYKSIQDTTMKLIFCIERYQDAIMALSQEENKLGRFLKEQAQVDKTPAGKMMSVIGKQLSQTSQQRLSCRVPLVRLYGDLDTFRNRAISDTGLSVQRMEGLRTEYRGALLWMKDVSSELNPDAYRQLDKFRKVQAQVKVNRDRFEKSKYAVCQKIDLLGASRCNLLSHDLEVYHQNMLHFWQKTAKEMNEICEQFKGQQHYEWSMLKELNDPSLKLQEQLEKNLSVEDKVEGQKQEEQQPDDPDNNEGLISWDADDFGAAEHVPHAAGQSSHEERPLGEYAPPSAAGPPPPYAGNPDLADLLMGDVGPTGSGGSGHYDTGLLDLGNGGGGRQTGSQSEFFNEGDSFDQSDKDSLALLNQIMNTSSTENDFSSEWKAVFGESSNATREADSLMGAARTDEDSSFLPSELLDMSMAAAGFSHQAAPTPSSSGLPKPPPAATSQDPSAEFGMFASAAPQSAYSRPMNAPPSANGKSSASGSRSNQKSSKPSNPSKQKQDMSAWFSLFADLDPLANPDAVGDAKQEGKIGI